MDLKIPIPDIQPLVAELDDMGKRQIPFALSTAVNEVLYETRQGMVKATAALFDRPTPLTQNSILYRRTRKTDTVISFTIFIQDEFQSGNSQGNPPNRFLFPEVEGGPRNQTRFERALGYAGLLPSGMAAVPSYYAPKDAYGNFKGSYIQILSQLQAAPDKLQNETSDSRTRANRSSKGRTTRYFVGKPGGGRLPLGIYQRLSEGVRPIFIFVKRVPSYRPRFPFYQMVQASFDARFLPAFKRNLQRALDTAK